MEKEKSIVSVPFFPQFALVCAFQDFVTSISCDYSGGPLSGNLFCIHFLALVLGTRFAPFNSACIEAMLKPH